MNAPAFVNAEAIIAEALAARSLNYDSDRVMVEMLSRAVRDLASRLNAAMQLNRALLDRIADLSTGGGKGDAA